MTTKSELLQIFSGVIDALDGLIAPNYEIVLHDLTRSGQTIEKIINGHISGRTVNSPLLSGPEDDQGFAGLLASPKKGQKYRVIKAYQTSTADGKQLQSASLICYDRDGTPDVALCINADMEPTALLARLQALITPVVSQAHPEDLTEPTAMTIDNIVARHQTTRKIGKEQRRVIVSEMHDRGIFKLKGSQRLASKALGVTRFTLHNDLVALGIKLRE